MSYNRLSDTVVYVRQASDLAGTLDSTKLYVVDGIIDMGTQSIEVPAGGLNLVGHTFDVSGLTSSENNYTMFTSPLGGSGNLLGIDYFVTTSGTGSKVYDLVSATGNDAFEFSRVNWVSCTSLGTIDGYRQGLESGTGRFGGSPSLELVGAWAGGYFIETSIIRGVSDLQTDAIYKAGTGFVMQSRFRTNQNVDLGALSPLIDFAPTNFPNPNTLQLEGCIITRNGVSDSSDSNITPNITRGDIASKFNANIGIMNTYVGGEWAVTGETETSITASSTFTPLLGTFTASDLQHFDSPANGQLRHLGDNPVEFKVIGDLVVDGGPNDELEVRIRRFNSIDSTTDTVGSQIRTVNNLQGGRDVALFNFNKRVDMLQNDYIFLEIANNTGTTNVTIETDSTLIVEAR